MKLSAGILVYKGSTVFLVHPSGPFDKGTQKWVIPKGETEEGENLWNAAVREWEEETGDTIKTDNYFDLGQLTRSGKKIHIFAVEQDAQWKFSNKFDFVFKNGTKRTFYETDSGQWFSFEEAFKVLPKNQKDFIQRLQEKLNI